MGSETICEHKYADRSMFILAFTDGRLQTSQRGDAALGAEIWRKPPGEYMYVWFNQSSYTDSIWLHPWTPLDPLQVSRLIKQRVSLSSGTLTNDQALVRDAGSARVYCCQPCPYETPPVIAAGLTTSCFPTGYFLPFPFVTWDIFSCDFHHHCFYRGSVRCNMCGPARSQTTGTSCGGGVLLLLLERST